MLQPGALILVPAEDRLPFTKTHPGGALVLDLTTAVAVVAIAPLKPNILENQVAVFEETFT